MKLRNLASVVIGLFVSGSLFAETVAIKNATVYTSTSKGILENATVVFENGKISAVNPKTYTADTTIDADGKVLTSGFIAALNQIGLVEVSAVAGSSDASAKKMDLNFDPSYAYNPESSLIPYTRKGGITRSVVAPSSWTEAFLGQAFSVLMNSQFDSLLDTKIGTVIRIGAVSKDSRASSLMKLVSKLSEQKDKLTKAKEKNDESDAKEPSDEEKTLTSLLNGEKPLVAFASRASDILHLIKIKQDFGVNVVVAGGHDAVKVKSQLAKSQIPVLLQVMDNLPGSFDSMASSLTTAGELEKAGVTVGLILRDSHMTMNLRTDAGNAVSYGMTEQGAIKAMTANIANIFGIEAGRIQVGSEADLVLWSGDPLEISSKVETMWIKGTKVSTEARHDKLRDRYVKQGEKPRAYK